jgi:hypothetical protein
MMSIYFLLILHCFFVNKILVISIFICKFPFNGFFIYCRFRTCIYDTDAATGGCVNGLHDG